eukprot:s1557_g5.t1
MFDDVRGLRRLEIAHSLDTWVHWRDLLRHAEALAQCDAVEQQGFGRCTIRAGRFEFPRHRPLRLVDGLGLVIRVPPDMPDQAWQDHVLARLNPLHPANLPEPEPDDVHLMARSAVLHRAEASDPSRMSDSSSSTPSGPSSSEVTGNDEWRHAVVVATDGAERQRNLPWDDADLLWQKVAQAFGITVAEVIRVRHVPHPPADLRQDGLECLLLQRAQDQPLSDLMRMTLADVEYKADRHGPQTRIVRRAKWMPRRINSMSIVRLLGFEAHCFFAPERCSLWRNGVLLDLDSLVPIHLFHGDYLRLSVPSHPEEDSPSSSCAHESEESGCCQDVPCDESPLYSDDAALLQLPDVVVMRSEPVPDKHDQGCHLPLDIAGGYGAHDAQFVHPGDTADHGLLQRASHQLQSQRQRGLQQEDVIIMSTWFLRTPEHEVCRVRRDVALPLEASLWLPRLRQVWRDRLHPGRPAKLHLVRQGLASFQLVLHQDLLPATTATIVSTAGEVDFTMAFVLPTVLTIRWMFYHIGLPYVCDQPLVDCQLRLGDHVVPHERLFTMTHGDHLHLIVESSPEPALADLSDDSSLLQTAVCEGLDMPRDQDRQEHSNFQFSASAAEFQPGQPVLLGMSDFIQDLFGIWSQSAFSWENEPSSCIVETWFVDHHWRWPHCINSRRLHLYGEFWRWEQQLRQLWRDVIQPAHILEFYVVQPTPPSATNEVAAHLLLIQQPSDIWVTSLVSVFENNAAGPSYTLNMAVTTHEHVLVEHLLTVVGLAGKCLLPTATHDYDSWYLDQRLLRGRPLPLRSGSGIIIQTRPKVHAASTGMSSTGQTLIQIHQHRQQIHLSDLIEDDETSQIAQLPTYVAILRAGTDDFQVPTYLELSVPPTEAGIADELRRWGHHCRVFQFGGHDEFLCLPQEIVHDPLLHHYMYCTKAGSERQAAFLHSQSNPIADDLGHMKLLHRLGFYKTAIELCEPLLDGWTRVVFAHLQPTPSRSTIPQKTPTPWPAPRPDLRPCPGSRPFDISVVQGQCGPCRLHFALDLAQIANFFADDAFPLCDNLDGLDLPNPITDVPGFHSVSTLPISAFDRIVVYADGSSIGGLRHQPPELTDLQGFPDTWAFLAIGEIYQSGAAQLHLIGWQTQPVHYQQDSRYHIGADRVGSDIAEKEALFWSAMWRLSVNLTTPTVFCSDSATTCGQAVGDLGTQEYCLPFILLRSVFQALEAILPGNCLQVCHVQGHAGDPFNDFVDYVAKQERERSYYLPRPGSLDMQTWRKILPSLWMLFRHDAGLPPLCQDGFDAAPPKLPDLTPAFSKPVDTSPESVVRLDLSIGTVNVLSLSAGPHGHGGKVEYVRQQYLDTHINLLGLQETRTERGTSAAGDVLRIASGGHRGHHGVELWVNLRQPYGYVDDRPMLFQRRHFAVLHADPRVLLVRLEAPGLHALCLVLHVPQSGLPLTERESWWDSLNTILLQHRGNQDSDLFVLADANATSGPCDDVLVGTHDDRWSVNTGFLRDFLEAQQLCLPSTFASHVGEHYTWISPNGELATRIDHVAVPQHHRPHCQFSSVVPHFDVGHAHLDHLLVAIQLQWQQVVCIDAGRHSLAPCFNRDDICKHSIEIDLQNYVVEPWDHNIDDQVNRFSDHVCSALVRRHPRRPQGPKKPYIDDSTWELRSRKQRLRELSRELGRRQRKELLFTALKGWTSSATTIEECQANQQYRITLTCASVRLHAELHVVAAQLRSILRTAKNRMLQSQLDQLPSNVSAGQVLRTVHRFHGPTNPKKIKRKPFPMLRQADGQVCQTGTAMRDRWAEFFCAMEGRAMGLDNIPPEVCKGHVRSMARIMYSQLLKMTLHGQEAIAYKGGRLTAAFKGKGASDDCASYRSLLVSSQFGKCLHRALRENQSLLYERFLQNQQIGGRKGIPVGLGIHHLRAFLRLQRRRSFSCGIVFLDLKEAFYRVLRPLALHSSWTDQDIAGIAQRLNLPSSILSDLHEHLANPCAVDMAQLPLYLRNCITAVHSDTWFVVDGQTEDVCRTTAGSRPGDCFADTVFGYLWARVLQGLEAQYSDLGLLEAFPEQLAVNPYDPAQSCAPEASSRLFLGPCWMDDLAIPLASATAQGVINKLGVAIGLLLDQCMGFGMTPNLSAGKTELILALRGAGSRSLRRQYYGAHGGQVFPIIGEHGFFKIRMVSRYRHLGGVIHHGGDQRQEAQQRLAVAHQTFTQQRKLLYGNPSLSLASRSQLFDSIVCSALAYGSESWVLDTHQMKQRLHSGVFKLYRRLLRIKPGQMITDDEVLDSLGLPTPSEIFSRARLRYFCTLQHCGSSAEWGLLATDEEWLALLRDDFTWMWTHLQSSTTLSDPRTSFAPWLYLMKYHRGYWKRLVNRAFAHAVRQRHNHFLVSELHRRIFDALQHHGTLASPAPQYCRDSLTTGGAFGCMLCRRSFRSRGGEGAHFFKAHGELLQYDICLMERHRYQAGQGIGSQFARQQDRAHDGALPPQQTHGAALAPVQLREPSEECPDLIVALVDALVDRPDGTDVELLLRDVICERTISWTRCCATLSVFKAHLDSDTAEDLGIEHEALLQLCDRLRDHISWDFLCAEDFEVQEIPDKLYHYERWCYELLHHDAPWKSHAAVPRKVGRDRVILHAFAGRRRIGDYQWYLDELSAKSDGYLLHVVSIDIVIDPQYGNLSDPKIKQFWLHGIRCGFVHGFLGGPPCATWSRARTVALHHGECPDAPHGRRRQPRAVRSAEFLWALPSLSLRELAQVTDGNDLLGFCLEAIAELAMLCMTGILEHPAEPEPDDLPSIWKTPIVQLLLTLPGVHRLRLAQGLLGADSPKPTELLAVNLPSLPSHLVAWRVTPDLPRHVNIGRDANGDFMTGHLKEYPPAMCAAMAHATNCSLCNMEVDPAIVIDPDFFQQCRALVCTDFGDSYGPDHFFTESSLIG